MLEKIYVSLECHKTRNLKIYKMKRAKLENIVNMSKKRDMIKTLGEMGRKQINALYEIEKNDNMFFVGISYNKIN